VLDHVNGEELLTDGMQRRDQRDKQGGISDEEQRGARLGARISPATPLRQPPVADGIRQADPDQREQ
jgi:hypothetical protein